MQASSFQTGDRVLILTGSFPGFEGLVKAVDPTTGCVSVTVEVFGRPVSLECGPESLDQYLTPFGDRPPVLRCPHEEVHRTELLSLEPGADAIFRSHFFRSMTWTDVLICRRGPSHHLVMRYLNMTWPLRLNPEWPRCELPLAASQWDQFARLIDASGFWGLPYDDGRRILRSQKQYDWRLEGYEQGRYHAVIRRAEQPRSAISDCCDFLRALAGIDWEDA